MHRGIRPCTCEPPEREGRPRRPIVDCGGGADAGAESTAISHAYGVSFSFHELYRNAARAAGQHGAKTMRAECGYTNSRRGRRRHRPVDALSRDLIEGPRLFYPGRALPTRRPRRTAAREPDRGHRLRLRFTGQPDRHPDGPGRSAQGRARRTPQGPPIRSRSSFQAGVVRPTDPLWMSNSPTKRSAPPSKSPLAGEPTSGDCHTRRARRALNWGVRHRARFRNPPRPATPSSRPAPRCPDPPVCT